MPSWWPSWWNRPVQRVCSWISARYVGVSLAQVDPGLEVELPISGDLQRRWHSRLLIDWGSIPGSYVDRFGRIDVLVNNAGNFYAGFFEEISPDDFRAQVETNLFGPLNVTRAVLPVMRQQRSGLVVAISSTAGLIGREFCTAYAASKFAVEGWIESLTPEVAPFGIRTMVVEPGFFRTELLTPGSTSYAEPSIDDYAERTAQTVTAWNGMNGLQGGDPAKLAAALVQLAGSDEPPLRWVAGADAVGAVERKATDLLNQVDAHRELSSSLAHDDATVSA